MSGFCYPTWPQSPTIECTWTLILKEKEADIRAPGCRRFWGVYIDFLVHGVLGFRVYFRIDGYSLH